MRLDVTQLSGLIQAIEDQAIGLWGDWGWKAALTEQYQKHLKANGIEQHFDTCRSTVNRVFSKRSCNAETLCYLAESVGYDIKLTPRKREPKPSTP